MKFLLLKPPYPEDEGNTLLRNVDNYLPFEKGRNMLEESNLHQQRRENEEVTRLFVSAQTSCTFQRPLQGTSLASDFWMPSCAGRCMLRKKKRERERERERRTRPKIQTNLLAYGKKIGPDNVQQAGTI